MLAKMGMHINHHWKVHLGERRMRHNESLSEQ